jgi:hypothetical protein
MKAVPVFSYFPLGKLATLKIKARKSHYTPRGLFFDQPEVRLADLELLCVKEVS